MSDNAKIVAIIQARMNSSRLPGKVFNKLAGKPQIFHVCNRLTFSKRITQIVLATTTNPCDDCLCDWAQENKISFYRGDENNVLDRFYGAAKEYGADIVIRITADDPFKDPLVIDSCVDLLVSEGLDFTFNNKPPSFPEGLDTEVFTFTALDRAHSEAESDFDKEHVTQYFYKNPSLFRMQNYAYREDVSNIRLTVDTAEDYRLASLLYDELSKENRIFYLSDILELLERHPEYLEINSSVKRSAMYVK
jgi:spore coat polysaccharide biosynthesis protein SpsF